MRNPKFHKLLKEIGNLHDKKNADYATPQDPFFNFRTCEKIGIPAWKGVLVRMSDKWDRLCNLANKEAKNEPIEDTLIDLAVYSLICKLLYEEYKNKRLPNRR